VILAMAKRPTKPQTHPWAVYVLEAMPARLVTIVDAPDVGTAIARAIEEEDLPLNQACRLIAQRRD
jgi:hypothetical protein